MRFSTVTAAAALAPAFVTAVYHADLKQTLGTARVHNLCPYDVYLWSVKKDQGCAEGNMKMLHKYEPGGEVASYSETYRDDHSPIGVSIKISKTDKCKGTHPNGKPIDITQLEYHINHDNPDFEYNFLDVSFVDCLGEDCPGRDQFKLVSGNNGDPRLATAGADKAICPILTCNSLAECATMAYILPDDVQTKSCEPAADMDFYMCSSTGDVQPPAPELPEPEPEPSTSAEAFVAAAQVTPAPVVEEPRPIKVKTEYVYVTAYVDAKKKRHAHGHRHAHFRA